MVVFSATVKQGGDGYDTPCEAQPLSSGECSGAGGDRLLLPAERDLVLEVPMSTLDGGSLLRAGVIWLEEKHLGCAVQEKAQLKDCIGDERTPPSLEVAQLRDALFLSLSPLLQTTTRSIVGSGNIGSNIYLGW